MKFYPENEIKPNPANPRIIKDEQFHKLVQSIATFPEMLQKRPLVCVTDESDGKLYPLGGNMRLKAFPEAKKWLEKEIKEWTLNQSSTSKPQINLLAEKSNILNLGIPVELADDWTMDQRREFIVKDNVQAGEWDFDMLANEYLLEELQDWGIDDRQLHVAFEEAHPEEDDYEVQEESKIVTDIKEYDVITIGKHRLVCGSSTDKKAVDLLFDKIETLPYIMATDPPYGVEYDASWRNDVIREDGSRVGARAIGKVMNDDIADWSEAWALSPAKVAYVYHAGKFSGTVQASLEKCDFEIRSQIIWAKSNFAISRGNYHWQHEPCWYAIKKGSTAQWIGDRKQTTLWEIDKPQKSETGHSTQKPIECMSKAIRNHEGDVHDPFLGSGTTLIASEKLNRICYGMELNPKYCWIIIDRALKYDPTLIVTKNGLPYNPYIS